jgi:hypothetical protein
MKGIVSMRWLLVLVFSLYACASGAAADPLLEKFYGKYGGFGTLETSDGPYYINTPRDFSLEILPLKPDGFRVVWSTLKHKGPNLNRLETEESHQATDFHPSGKQGVYHAAGNTGVLEGGLTSWARVQGPWLVVYRLVIGDKGIPEMHIYRRVVTPQGLGLRFSAIRDGKEVRTVSGRYRRE